jgi:hypothetical protein
MDSPPVDSRPGLRASPWSLGLVMIIFACGSLLVARSHGEQPGATAAVAAGALAVGGLALLLRRRASFYIALAAALTTVAFALVSFVTRRVLGLPLPPLISLVIGLYISFRLALARRAMSPPPPPTE